MPMENWLAELERQARRRRAMGEDAGYTPPYDFPGGYEFETAAQPPDPYIGRIDSTISEMTGPRPSGFSGFGEIDQSVPPMGMMEEIQRGLRRGPGMDGLPMRAAPEQEFGMGAVDALANTARKMMPQTSAAGALAGNSRPSLSDFSPSGLQQEHLDYQPGEPDLAREHMNLPSFEGSYRSRNPKLDEAMTDLEQKAGEGYIAPGSPTDNLGKLQQIMRGSRERSDSLVGTNPVFNDRSPEFSDKALDSMVIQDGATPEFIKRARLIARSNAGAKSAFGKPPTPGEKSDQELDSAVAEYKGGAKVIDGSKIPKGYGKDSGYGIGANQMLGEDAAGLDYADRRQAEVAQRHKDAVAYRRGMLTDEEYAGLGGPDSGIANLPGITGPMGLSAGVMMGKNARESKIAELKAQAEMKIAEAEMLKAETEGKDQGLAEDIARKKGELPPKPVDPNAPPVPETPKPKRPLGAAILDQVLRRGFIPGMDMGGILDLLGTPPDELGGLAGIVEKTGGYDPGTFGGPVKKASPTPMTGVGGSGNAPIPNRSPGFTPVSGVTEESVYTEPDGSRWVRRVINGKVVHEKLPDGAFESQMPSRRG